MSDEIWYRVAVQRRGRYSPDGDFEYAFKELVVEPFRVARHTPKGVVLKLYGFVRGKAVRQIAVPTVELAYRDAILRTERRISLLKGELAYAEDDMKYLLRGQIKEQKK